MSSFRLAVTSPLSRQTIRIRQSSHKGLWDGPFLQPKRAFGAAGESEASSSSRRFKSTVSTTAASSTLWSDVVRNGITDVNPSAALLALRSASMDLWSTLRRQAAMTLTASLPVDEREELILKFSPTKSSTPVMAEEQPPPPPQHSIAELVAQVKMQEALQYEAKWEREKMRLWEEAERAARERVEQEIQIRNYHQEQQQLQQQEQHTQQQQDVDRMETVETTEPTNTVAPHPVLGAPVADLGYKRVFLVASQDLAALPVWEKQRIYRHNRAKVMAQDKLKSLHLGLPGVIALHEDRNGNLSIIDGQHRVGMMSILQEKQVDGIDLSRILVEVYPQQDQHSDSHAQELFLEVNKAEPVKLVDMPGVARVKDRKLLTELADRLQERYPTMFSDSQKCRPPNVNIDNLRDALFAADVMTRHNLSTVTALESWVLEQNRILATKYQSSSMDSSAAIKVSERALTKAKENNFYLGLDSSWYYH